MTDLAGHADPEILIPACPTWTVRDLIAHLACLCEDCVVHRLDAYASDAWTAAQVERFSNSSIQQILERWDEAAESFRALPEDPIMGPRAHWAFGDAVIHEADLRDAIGAAPVRMDAVALALKGMIARWRKVLGSAAVPTLRLRAPDLRDWWLGIAGDTLAVTVETPATRFSGRWRASKQRAGAALAMGW